MKPAAACGRNSEHRERSGLVIPALAMSTGVYAAAVLVPSKSI